MLADMGSTWEGATHQENPVIEKGKLGREACQPGPVAEESTSEEGVSVVTAEESPPTPCSDGKPGGADPVLPAVATPAAEARPIAGPQVAEEPALYGAGGAGAAGGAAPPAATGRPAAPLAYLARYCFKDLTKKLGRKRRDFGDAGMIQEFEASLSLRPPPFVRLRRSEFVLKKAACQTRGGWGGDRETQCPCAGGGGGAVAGGVECGPRCLCRMLYNSCSKACPCSGKCRNKAFHLQRAKKMRVVKTEDRGWGVVADKGIPGGDFVVEYIGEVIDDATCEQRLWDMKEAAETNFYLVELAKDLVVDASFKGNASRFINHSCSPNLELQKWQMDGELRIGLFALEDIHKGTELSYDYQFETYALDNTKCCCGAPNCRGSLGRQRRERGRPSRLPTTLWPAAAKAAPRERAAGAADAAGEARESLAAGAGAAAPEPVTEAAAAGRVTNAAAAVGGGGSVTAEATVAGATGQPVGPPPEPQAAEDGWPAALKRSRKQCQLHDYFPQRKMRKVCDLAACKHEEEGGAVAGHSTPDGTDAAEPGPAPAAAAQAAPGGGDAAGLGDIPAESYQLIGSRILVWWPLDQKWYPGVVAEFNETERKHLIQYDDGEDEILTLKDEQWKAEEASTLPPSLAKRNGRRESYEGWHVKVWSKALHRFRYGHVHEMEQNSRTKGWIVYDDDKSRQLYDFTGTRWERVFGH